RAPASRRRPSQLARNRRCPLRVTGVPGRAERRRRLQTLRASGPFAAAPPTSSYLRTHPPGDRKERRAGIERIDLFREALSAAIPPSRGSQLPAATVKERQRASANTSIVGL